MLDRVDSEFSAIILDDPESVRVDDGPKSLAYFCQRLPVRVDGELMAQLKKKFFEVAPRNLRLCLHDGPEAAFHEMIIFERKGKYYRPHKHADKGESFHLIEGRMGVFAFDEQGKVLDACVLTPEGTAVYRVAPGMHHAVMPLSDYVVYHESKPGPFLGEGDSIYPSWAPKGDNSVEVEAYVKSLRDALEG